MKAGIAVIGCGLIGARRAAAAQADPRSALRCVVDADAARARALADARGCDTAPTWQEAVRREDVTAVVVSTPNALLAEIACAALAAGKHVLIEKPMGRNAGEAEAMAAAAERAGRVLKVGFNHRYHPALAAAHSAFAEGAIGELLHLRARYGHGSRPGCEREWRADPELAGGGELLDQGVHVLDLFHWFAGSAESAYALLQTAVWRIEPLEDNAFALLRYARGVAAQLHVSMTQWQNLFSLEVVGSTGALVVEGLGGSYGTERLTRVRRNLAGGSPEVTSEEFPGPDLSWQDEWHDFMGAVAGAPLRHGRPADGVRVMRAAAALYRSAREEAPVAVAAPAVPEVRA